MEPKYLKMISPLVKNGELGEFVLIIVLYGGVQFHHREREANVNKHWDKQTDKHKSIVRQYDEGWILFMYFALVGGWDHADFEAGVLCGSPAAECKDPEPAVWQLPHAAAPQTVWEDRR